MMIKKVLLLASMVLAVVAVAAPAGAQAVEPFWYTTGTPDIKVGGEAESETIDGTGSLSFTVGGFKSGPCEVHIEEGYLWNSGTMGEGEITEFKLADSCPTNQPNCAIHLSSNNTEGGAKWPITALNNDEVKISNITFSHLYVGSGCPGGENFLSAAGTVTGTFNNETSCIEFKNAAGLAEETVKMAGVVNGSVCPTSEVNKLTLK